MTTTIKRLGAGVLLAMLVSTLGAVTPGYADDKGSVRITCDGTDREHLLCQKP